MGHRAAGAAGLAPPELGGGGAARELREGRREQPGRVALAAGEERGESPPTPSFGGPARARLLIAVLVGGRVVLRRGHEPQRGEAAPHRACQKGPRGAPWHPGSPGEGRVEECGLVEEGGSHVVPGCDLQQTAWAALPHRMAEQVPRVVRGGAPGEEVLSARLSPLAERAGGEGPGGRREVHRRAGDRQPGSPRAGAGVRRLRVGDGRHP